MADKVCVQLWTGQKLEYLGVHPLFTNALRFLPRSVENREISWWDTTWGESVKMAFIKFNIRKARRDLEQFDQDHLLGLSNSVKDTASRAQFDGLNFLQGIQSLSR